MQKKGIKSFKLVLMMGLAIFMLFLSFSTVNAQEANVQRNGNIVEVLNSFDDGSTGNIITLAEGEYKDNGKNYNITINKNVTIKGNGTGAIINGEGKSRIFTINDGLNVSFINIKFLNGYVNETEKSLGGIAIYASGNSITLDIENCIFNNNSGYGSGGVIYAGGVNLSINNSSFNNNSAPYQSSGGYGGVIYVKDSILSINNSIFNNTLSNRRGGVIFNRGGCNISISNSIFNNNSARTSGGVIDNYGSFNLSISNSIFNNNSVFGSNAGGGVIYSGSNLGILNISNSSFNDNSATVDGGVIYTTGNITIVDSNFTNNSANDNGGVIYTAGGILSINKSNFTNNSADYGCLIYNAPPGRVYSLNITNFNFNIYSPGTKGGAIYNNGRLNIRNSNFTNYHATVDGGVIYNTGNLTIFDSNFTNNHADNYGGVIYTTGSLDIDNSIFKDNYGTNGVAIANWGNLSIHNSKVINNLATNNAIIYTTGVNSNVNISDSIFNDNSAANSGVIYNGDNSYLNLINSNFTNNSATDSGGAIYNDVAILDIDNSIFNDNSAYSGAIYINGGSLDIANSIFNDNFAYNGGAIYNKGGLNISNSNFTNNSATGSGGAIYNDYGSLDIANSNFTNNSANSGDGGVIHLNGGSLDIANSNFTNNSANSGGGVIYNNGGVILSISDSIFKDNYGVTLGGGAIHNMGTILNINNSNFIGNFAGNDDGGAIWNYWEGILNVYNSNFTNNSASDLGGAIYNQEGYLHIIDSIFENNYANFGGAIGSIRIFDLGFCNLSGSVFINNYATSNGGVIWSSMPMNITNSTFVSNFASNGGVIYSEGVYSNLSISESVFNDNSANTNGGAIYNPEGYLNIIDSIFENNYANFGGAIGSIRIFDLGFCNLSGSVFINNYATSNGGVIWSSMPMNITNSTFVSNFASNGGVIYGDGEFSNLSISGSVFNNNSAINGGAIFNDGNYFNVSSSLFEFNHATHGGGVYTSNNGNISNSKFYNNSQAIALNGINYSINANEFVDNGIGIQFVFNNYNDYIIPISLLKNNNSVFENNNYAFGISGTGSSYVLGGNLFNGSKIGFIVFADGSGNTLKDSNIFNLDSAAIVFDRSSNNDKLLNTNLTGNNIAIIVMGSNSQIIGNNILDNDLAINLTNGAANSKINSNRIINNSYLFNSISNGKNNYNIVIGTDSGLNNNLNSNWWGKNNLVGLISGDNNKYNLNDYFVLLFKYGDKNNFVTYVNTTDKITLDNQVISLYLALNTSSSNNIITTGINSLPRFTINLVLSNNSKYSYNSHNLPYTSSLKINKGSEFWIKSLSDNEDITLKLRHINFNNGIYVNSSWNSYNGDGNSWNSPFKNISAALNAIIANGLNSYNTNKFIIHIAGNNGGAIEYTGKSNIGIELNNAFNNLTLQGEFGNAIFNAKNTPNTSIFVISGNNITLKNLTFLNGNSNDGGAITNSGDNLNIIDSKFVNNSADNDGGAITNSGDNLNIKNSSFSNNSADNDGGAIHSSVPVNIDDSEFIDNSAKKNEDISVPDVPDTPNSNGSDSGNGSGNGSDVPDSPNTPVNPNTPNTPKLPDLKIYKVQKSGNYCIVYIKNYGKATAKSSYLTASAKGVTYRFSVKSIKSGKTTSVKFLIPKKYRAIYNTIDKTFKIDSTNRVKESNEKNNVMIVRANKPDLKIYKVQKSGSNRYIYIKNYGNIPSKACYLSVSAAGKSVSLKVKAISAGKSISVKLTIPNKYRKYLNVYKTFKVDSGNTVKESNEKNNSFRSK